MGSVTSSLIISLIDKVSGPAKGAAAALKGVAAAEKSLSGASGAKGADRLAASLDRAGKAAQRFQAEAKTGLGWGSTFQKDIDKLKLTSREIESVRRDYERLQSTFRGMKAGAVFDTLEGWKTRTIANIHAVRNAEQEFAQHQKRLAERHERMSRGVVGGARLGLGVVGAGSGVYAVQRTARAAVKASAVAQREDARDYLAGMSASDTARISRAALNSSTRFPSVDASTMHERLRDTSMSMRSTDKALELSDTIAQGTVVLQSLKGKEQAIEEGRKFFAALDVLGKNIDPKQVRGLFHGYIKAMGVEGADMDLGGALTMARQSRAAGGTLSDRFLITTAPGLARDLGDPQLGTALSSGLSQNIGGRLTPAAKKAQEKFGLRSKKGKFLHSDLYQSDPDLYAWNVLMPALEKQGVNVKDPKAVNGALAQVFSNRTVNDVFTKLISQVVSYQGKAEQYGRAPGLDAAGPLAQKDPFVALEGVMAQLRNFASQAPVMDSAAAGLNSLAGAIANLTKELSGNKLTTGEKVAASTAVTGGVVGTAGLMALGARGAYRWFTGGGAKPPPMEGAGNTAGTASKATGRGFFRSLMRAAPWAIPLIATTRPDIVNDEGVINHIKKRVQEAEAAKAAQGSYGRDYTLGNEGGFSKTPSIVPPGGFKTMTEYNASRVAPTPLGQRQPIITPHDDTTFTTGASAVQGLDMSGAAGAAGSKSGSAFKQNIQAELNEVDALIRAKVQSWAGMLSFSASPSITPKLGVPGPTPKADPRQGAADTLKQNRHAAFADGLNFGSFA